MKAMSLFTPGPIGTHPMRLGELPDPQPAAGEVVIRVRSCGVCRSNLHMVEGDWVGNGVPAFSPMVPGHEVVGVIEQIGDGVDTVHVGDRVGVQPIWSTCGYCEYCVSGVEELCQTKLITGETVNGGYAELLLAKAAYIYRIPNGLDDVAAAPLLCPGITGYGAVAKAHLTPARSAAVFGIGGVGHVALQFARLTGAHTIAVTRSADRRDLARELGADRAIPLDGAGAALAGEGGVDAALVFAPSHAAVAEAIKATKPGGTIVLGVNAEVGPLDFSVEKTVVGSLLGTREMMREVLNLAAAGKVHVEARAMPLAEANEALEQLAAGSVRGRLVLTP